MAVESIIYHKETDLDMREMIIRLSRVNITEQAAEQIVGAMQGRKVGSLKITDSTFEKGALAILAKAIGQIDPMCTVYLSGNQIDDEGAKLLTAALINKQIKVLDLSHNNIGDSGAVDLAKAWKANQLASLTLTHNQIGPIGAKALAETFAHSNKDKLDLSYNLLGDKGAEVVAIALARQEKKASIHLAGNQIGPQGDLALAKYLPHSITAIYQTETVDFDTLKERDPKRAFDIYREHSGQMEVLNKKTFDVEKPGLLTDRSTVRWGFKDYVKVYLINSLT